MPSTVVMYASDVHRMVRKQVYIEARQEKALEERAKQLGVTEAELIRRSLDRGLEGLSPRKPDPEAWREVMRYIRRRMRGRVRGAPRRWNGGEPYDR